VTVETWLIPWKPWHVRVHHIQSERPLKTIEGGFAIPRDDRPPTEAESGPGFARVLKDGDGAAAYDLALKGALARQGLVCQALPNSSLYFPQTHVPQLHVDIEPGETWLAGAFLGSPNGLATPPPPLMHEKLQRMLDGTTRVKGMKFKEALHHQRIPVGKNR
jgi:hypothetical protein